MSRANSRTKSTIYISGFDQSVNEEAIHYAFIPFGDIVEVQLPKDEKQNQHRGFALVEFETPEDAEAAVDNMNMSVLKDRTIRVTMAKPQRETTNIQDSKVAVWDQETWLQEHVVDESDRKAVEESIAEGEGIDPMQQLEVEAN